MPYIGLEFSGCRKNDAICAIMLRKYFGVSRWLRWISGLVLRTPFAKNKSAPHNRAGIAVRDFSKASKSDHKDLEKDCS